MNIPKHADVFAKEMKRRNYLKNPLLLGEANSLFFKFLFFVGGKTF